MSRTKKQEIKEPIEEKEIPNIVPYSLTPPCLFKIENKKFDKERMDGYEWREKGRFWDGTSEILILEVFK